MIAAVLEAAVVAGGRSRRASERLRCHAAQLAAAPEARRHTILAALMVAHPELRYHVLIPADRLPGGRDRWIAAHLISPYPGAPLAVQARVVLGESPAQISGGLTRAEAHRWLVECPGSTPQAALLAWHAIPAEAVRSVRVARWLVECWGDPPRRAALERHREELGPGGVIVSGRYLDRADELRDRDLCASVDATYRRVGTRLRAEYERALARPAAALASQPAWWRPIRCARLLLTGPALVAEGRALAHCVAAYAPAVRRGDCVIVALDVAGHRSTVEIDRRTRQVRQHKAHSNSLPHDLCTRALAVCLRRWTTTTHRRRLPCSHDPR